MYNERTKLKIEAQIEEMGFRSFDWGDGVVRVSAEEGDSAADYWGEFRGNCPWINPKLEALAEKYDCFWEWMNPGAIALYE